MKLMERVITAVILSAIFILLWFRGKINQKGSPIVEIKEDIRVLDKRNDKITFTIIDEEKQVEDGPKDLSINGMHPWDVWQEMVTARKITGESDRFVQLILKAMATSKILKAGVGYKGTQLKAMLTLDGPEQQKVVFKPRRYLREKILGGTPYEGYDRHNAEIAAFHLDRILGFNRAPPAVGRYVDLQTEVKPVCTERLLQTFFQDGDNICFYGVCMYCKLAEPACANGKIMEGSVTLWLPDKWKVGKMRHPWQRTYTSKKKARWETDKNYCESVIQKPPYDKGPRLLDIMDASVFDFLIGNADRHHYEYLAEGGNEGMLLLMDNGKSFGNPYKDEESILAPLYQCCRLRSSTYKRLQDLSSEPNRPLSSLLEDRLKTDPIYPILTKLHLDAIDRRLATVLHVLQNCFDQKGKTNVLQEDMI